MSSYKFGPLESSGFIGGMNARQAVSAAVFASFAYIVIQRFDGLASLAGAVLIGAFGYWFTMVSISGRSSAEWTDISLRYLLRRVTGRLEYRSAAPTLGHVGGLTDPGEPTLDLPASIAGIEILGGRLKGVEVGVAFDKQNGAYTATLHATADSFALIDPEQQEAKLRGWSSVLGDFSRVDSPVSRIQWVEQTIPANQGEMMDYLRENIEPVFDESDKNVRSYLKLLANAGAVQQKHELLLTLRIENGDRRTRKLAARMGKGHDGYCALLLREMQHFAAALEGADIRVLGLLRPASLARVIRGSFNPYAMRNKVDKGISPAAFGPMEAGESWEVYVCEGVGHVTYWISGWPRTDVGATFLAPLILNTSLTRAIGVTMQTVPVAKAMRQVQSAATGEDATMRLKMQKNFRIGADQRNSLAAIEEREAELSVGFTEMRFAGFISVSGATPDELDAACAEIEQAASQAHIELTRLSGEQETALSYTMPLARGLQTGVL